jgi:hypothetical protein
MTVLCYTCLEMLLVPASEYCLNCSVHVYVGNGRGGCDNPQRFVIRLNINHILVTIYEYFEKIFMNILKK